ncbi:hypothetical protein GCM10008941_11830 [Rhizomicrobium palustre]
MGLEQLIPEEQVRARSYMIWENEGRPDGRSEEFWLRAAAELERELEKSWLVALEERENLELCMPKLPISKPLQRHEAGRVAMPEAA